MVKVKMFEISEHKNRPAVDAPITDAKAFNDIVNSRRSVRFYSSDDIPQDVIDSCLDAALKAPNSSNLQTWQIHHVVDSDKKKELVILIFTSAFLLIKLATIVEITKIPTLAAINL